MIAKCPEEIADESCRFLAGGWRYAQQDFGCRAGCEIIGGSGDGETFFGAIRAGGQIGNGEIRRGCGDDGARRRHAIEQPEDFQLRFEFVGDAVDDEIGVTDSVLNGGNKGNRGQCLRTERKTNRLARVMQIAGHHIFKKNVKAGAGSSQCERTAKRAGSDDGNRRQLRGDLT